MGYRRQKNYSRYNSRFASTGGYDATGRWRSEAWHMDGGANDEGWHQAYCNRCGKVTEHGRGSGCVPCGDRMAATHRRRASKKNPVPNPNPHKLDRWAVLKLYEVKAGNLLDFLESLRDQNEKRPLSPKQVEVGSEILKGFVESDIVDRLWSRTLPRDESKEITVGSIVRLKDAVNPMRVLKNNGRGEILLEGIESENKSWALNDGRWVSIA
tara:strand:- start:665 stop:1300 length:636 start_codon:yes stop_codon:yes gene_type:complete